MDLLFWVVLPLAPGTPCASVCTSRGYNGKEWVWLPFLLLLAGWVSMRGLESSKPGAKGFTGFHKTAVKNQKGFPHALM